MPDYTGLRLSQTGQPGRGFTETSRARAVDNLMKLRAQLKATVPPQDLRSTMLLATWNIREFDSTKYGARCAEAYYYIAEIVSHFDLLAIQEVNADLTALNRLMWLLGPWWKFIVTDVTLGTGGNQERLAFLYDSRKVTFTGLAGELVLPDPPGGKERVLQFARTPFLCGFQSGWCKFTICTVHIYYGKGTPVDERRVQEIQQLANTLAAMGQGGTRKTRSAVDGSTQSVETAGQNIIVLGDFNIFNVKDATFAALKTAGFEVPDKLVGGKAANLDHSKHYDQIAYFQRGGRFRATGRADVFNFQDSVFGKEQLKTYEDLIDPQYLVDKNGKAKDPAAVYGQWRTHQMSDHLLLWAEFQVDFADDYLMRRKQDSAAPVAATAAAAAPGAVGLIRPPVSPIP